MDRDQQIKAHQEKWKRWNMERQKQAMKKKINIQEGLENYAIKIVEKLSMPQKKNNNNNKISQKIENQIQSNICGICLELMIPPHNPMVLFPCGHNICKCCLYQFGEETRKVYKLKVEKCPICRVPIKSHAVNRNLMTLICTYSDNKHLLIRQIEKEQEMQEEQDDIEQIRIRYKILDNQKQNLQKELLTYKKHLGVLEEVVSTLKDEKKRNQRQMETLQEQAKLIQKHLTEKNQETESVQKKLKQISQKEKIIERTLAPLKLQKEKMQLLEIARLLEDRK